MNWNVWKSSATLKPVSSHNECIWTSGCNSILYNVDDHRHYTAAGGLYAVGVDGWRNHSGWGCLCWDRLKNRTTAAGKCLVHLLKKNTRKYWLISHEKFIQKHQILHFWGQKNRSDMIKNFWTRTLKIRVQVISQYYILMQRIRKVLYRLLH